MKTVNYIHRAGTKLPEKYVLTRGAGRVTRKPKPKRLAIFVAEIADMLNKASYENHLPYFDFTIALAAYEFEGWEWVNIKKGDNLNTVIVIVGEMFYKDTDTDRVRRLEDYFIVINNLCREKTLNEILDMPVEKLFNKLEAMEQEERKRFEALYNNRG